MRGEANTRRHGMAEMVSQSHTGETGFLPALPKAWPQGSVNRLRAQSSDRILAARQR